jgi:hypothetical protein
MGAMDAEDEQRSALIEERTPGFADEENRRLVGTHAAAKMFPPAAGTERACSICMGTAVQATVT